MRRLVGGAKMQGKLYENKFRDRGARVVISDSR